MIETDASRTVTDRNNYTAWGEPWGATTTDGAGYTGHVMDQGTGLTYMQQRYYDPVVGRFLSVDPMAVDTTHAINFNRYNYALNNPYRFTDPDGRCPWCIGAGVGAVLEVAVQGAEIAMGTRTEFSGREILISAVAGATGAGAAKLIGRAGEISRAAKFVANRISDAAISAGSQDAKTGHVDPASVVIDTLTGGLVGDQVGARAAGVAERSAAGQVLERQANRAERVAADSSRAARQDAASTARAAQKDHVNGAAASAGTAASNAASAGATIACKSANECN